MGRSVEAAPKGGVLHNQGTDWNNIALLYGSKPMQTKLYYAFKENDLPYYWGTMNGKMRNVMSVEDVVRSSTVQGLKGLEFSRVFICGENDHGWPDGDDETVRRLLYVGMTRAMDRLTVTFSGEGPVSKTLTSM